MLIKIVLLGSEYMDKKYLIAIVVVIVAIGGATACSFLLPNDDTAKVEPTKPAATTAPANDTKKNDSQEKVEAKTVKCTYCGGTGILKCGNCGGDGLIGSGSCPTCGGDGKVYYDENNQMHPNVMKIIAVLACHEATCPTCGGSGGGSQTQCTACGGDGKIVCSKCGGDGYIVV